MRSPAKSPHSIAIIGAGTISQSVHIPSALRAGLDVTWVCDLSPSRAAHVARRAGARSATDPAAVLADPTLEAVLIATPGSHAALTAAALQAGKHVLAEKPLAMTLADIDNLAALAASQRLVVQVGYMKMYDPLMERARTESAALRDTRLVRITVAHPADDPQVAHLRMGPAPTDADPSAIAAAEQAEVAASAAALPGASPALLAYYRGVLNGSVIHELSLLRALGLPLPSQWRAETYPGKGGAPQCLLATAAVGEARYVLNWNWLPDYPEYDEELKVLAANGRLTLNLAKPYLLEDRSTLTVERHDGMERRATTYLQAYETGFLRQLDAFIAAIERRGPVVADLAGARQDVRQLQLIAQAIGRAQGQDVLIEGETRP